MEEQTTKEAIAESWQLFKETNAHIKETDAQLKETDAQLKKTDVQINKTSEEVAKTTASIQRLEGLFGKSMGRLIEALVKPGVLQLFKDRGHAVRYLHQRSESKQNGETMEIDLLLENGDEVIPVEVKTNLTVEWVDYFLDDLAEFTKFFPKYTNYRIYGAVAGLEIPQDVARYAYKKGLFVVSISGTDMVEILNDSKFRPKDFGPLS